MPAPRPGRFQSLIKPASQDFRTSAMNSGPLSERSHSGGPCSANARSRTATTRRCADRSPDLDRQARAGQPTRPGETTQSWWVSHCQRR